MSEPLVCVVYASLAVAAICWVLSVLTREYSWVDRIWSVVPALYVAWFAWSAGFGDARLVLMSALTAAWGTRLTFNFVRKGGYKPGGEDYRWAEVRTWMSPFLFQVFNFAFIALYQNVLLLLITLPAAVAYEHRGTPLGALDVIAALLFVAFLAGETIADEQQWRFHQDKHARKARGEAVPKQFLTTGLFRYSRHPNFFCEQGMWWSLYLFSVAAGGGWINWSILGAILLSLLFQGSTDLTEKLTRRKYPDYEEYQRTTSRLLPMPPRR